MRVSIPERDFSRFPVSHPGSKGAIILVSIPERDFSRFPVSSSRRSRPAASVSIPERDFSRFPGVSRLSAFTERILPFQSLKGILVDFQNNLERIKFQDKFQSLKGILVDFQPLRIAFRPLSTFQSLKGILVDFQVRCCWPSTEVNVDSFQSLKGILVDFQFHGDSVGNRLSPVSIPERDFSRFPVA